MNNIAICEKHLNGFNKGDVESIKVVNEYLNLPMCIVTNEPIYYSNTKISRTRTGGFRFYGTSAFTIKKINDIVYNLKVSEKGMLQYFGEEFNNINKSRIFNTVNKFSKFAFGIDDNIAKKYNQSTAITLENQIAKYGLDEGTKRYHLYVEKQRNTNTFEYKKKTKGWNLEDFKKFNKSRAITLDNLITKYGEVVGTLKFDKYCEKQSKTSTSEYLLERFGEERLTEILKSRAHHIDFYIQKYGNEEGYKRFLEYWENSNKLNKYQFSKISIEFFNLIVNEISTLIPTFNIYYGLNEYGILCSKTKKYFKYDFTIPELKLIIEYNGDNFHANPKIYKEYENPNFRNPELSAKDIWEYDREKKECAMNERGFDVIYIWDSEYRNNKLSIIKNVIDEIQNRRNR